MATQQIQDPPEVNGSVGIGEVVVAELEEIAHRRGKEASSFDPACWIQHCHQQNLFGICLSGGGIRAATFALGVLQGLVEKKLLSKADYISTVSGGGYLGAWLQGVAARESDYREVLCPKRTPDLADKDPITFLRKYSNYLAPRNGLSLDFVVIPLIWFRNMMLNQAIIISALMALYIVLLVPAGALRYVAMNGSFCLVIALGLLALVSASIAVWRIGAQLYATVKRKFEEEPPPEKCKPVLLEQHVGQEIANPLLVAVLLQVYLLSVFRPNPWGYVVEGVLLYTLVFLLQSLGGFLQCYSEQHCTKKDHPEAKNKVTPRAWLQVVWMSGITASFLLLLIANIWRLCDRWQPATPLGSHLVTAWAVPLYFLALFVGIGLHIGLMGRDFPDASREWLARLGALLLSYIVIWSLLFALGIFAPFGIAKLWLWTTASKSRIGAWIVSSGIGTWLLTTLMSVLAGKSSKTGSLNPDQQNKQSTTIDLIARYGPLIAIPGILAAVAFATQVVLHYRSWCASDGWVKGLVDSYWPGLPFTTLNWIFPFLLLVFLVAVFLVLSVRVNINEFSMHHFYKNRLVRCYLGASATQLQGSGVERCTRKPDPFTGFDPKDDLKLSSLRSREQEEERNKKAESGLKLVANKPRVPYPLMNATLTVTAGVELATQERKALPWFFGPLYSGFFPARSDVDREMRGADPPYANTQHLGQGVSLGTAMAISGAAVSPNWGFHSSPQTAFLLTLFNVRLGWWMGNPTRGEEYITRPGPAIALWWLLRELFGFVDEGSGFVNLSDGGNFENLGLYELVRRRCRHIIVIDAEQDQDYLFESLGGAVRKCRADFGVEIQINPRPILPQPKFSRTHCVVGRILYPQEDSECKQDPQAKAEPEKGYLLYLKSSITGDEPADVEEYRRENPDFPQQSTLDQFFSESQFESYRRLGLHVARTALDHLPQDPNKGEADYEHEREYLKRVFERLDAQWTPPPPAPEGTSARHAKAYAKLLADTADSREFDHVALKDFPKELDEARRRSFYFHLQLLQFIERVFLDLNFASAETWNHPAMAGWKQLIEYWATREGMKHVWDTQKKSYGQPFQNYFDDLVNKNPGVPPDEQH